MAAGVQVASLYAKLGVDMGSAMRDLKSFRGEIDGASGNMGKLQSAVGTGLKVAAGVGVAAVGALATGIGVATKQAASMEQAVADIRAMMGLTAEQTEELKGLITDLGLDPKLKVSAVEAASAIEMLGKNGLTMSQIMDGAAKNTVLLANSTGADFAQAADIATDVMAQFNIGAADMETAVNGITGVTQSSKFDINDYALAIAQAGGVASSVGVSFDDFNATIAAISPLFASGSDAGTSFKTFLQRLAPDTDKAKDAMAQLGLYTEETGSAFFTAQGQLKPMPEIAELLSNAFSGLSEQQKITAASTIFGTDAMRAAFGVANAGRGTMEELQATIGNTSAIDAAAVRMDTLQGAYEIFQGIIETLTISVGDKFLPVARRLVEWTSELASKYGPPVIKWAGMLADQMLAVMDGTASILAPLQGVIDNLGNFMTAAREVLRPVADAVGKFVTWKDALGALGIVIASIVIPALGSIIVAIAPVLAQFALLTATVAAVRMAWQNDFWGIRTTAQKVLQDLSDWFFKESGIWRGTWEDTLKYLQWWGQWGWRDAFYNPIVIWIRDTRWEIRGWYNNTVQQFKDWVINVKFAFDQWVGDVRSKFEHWASVTHRAVEVWIGVQLTKFMVWKNKVMAVIREWTDDVRDWVTKWLDRFGISDWLQKGRDIIGGLWNGFREKWYDFINWTGQVWSDWVNRFKNFFGIHSPSTLFKGYGSDLMAGLRGGVADGATGVLTTLDALSRNMLSRVDQLGADVRSKLGNITGGLSPEQAKINAGQNVAANQNAAAFSYAIERAGATFRALSGMSSTVVDWVAEFAKGVSATLTKAGVGTIRPDGSMIPLSVNTRQAINNLSNTDLTSNNSSEMVVQAIMTLVQELRSRGLGNQFNITNAPTEGSTTDQGLFQLVTYLQTLYA